MENVQQEGKYNIITNARQELYQGHKITIMPNSGVRSNLYVFF